MQGSPLNEEHQPNCEDCRHGFGQRPYTGKSQRQVKAKVSVMGATCDRVVLDLILQPIGCRQTLG